MTTERERGTLEAELFVASSLAQDLRAAVKEAAPRIGFSDLARSLLQPEMPEAAAILRRAVEDSVATEMLEGLARKIAVAAFPEVAAASAGDLSLRSADGFALRLLPSLEESGPVYLLVERTDAGAALPRLLIGIPSEGEAALAALPESAEYPLQLLFPPDAPLVRLFRDPDSRFFLT